MCPERHLDLRELIIYLTPSGLFAAQCERFFEQTLLELGPSTAHAYPPHVTLTGFFKRSPQRTEEIIAEFDSLFGSELEAPEDAVRVLDIETSGEWVGIEVQSNWAHERVSQFVRSHRVDHDEDSLRPKDWLHLSLAYGDLPDGRELASYEIIARRRIDHDADVTWRLGLWERSNEGTWRQHC